MSVLHIIGYYVIMAAVSAITAHTALVAKKEYNTPYAIALGILWPVTIVVFAADTIYYVCQRIYHAARSK
jgi:hypothetical protein